MAERPMEPQAFNTLTSFYKNKGFKPKNPSKSVFASCLYYGMSEMKDGNKFSAFLWWKPGKQQLSIKKVNRKVQEEPQAEAVANPRHQEEEKKRHRLTCAQLTNKCTISTKTSSLFPKQGDQNAKRTEKHIDKKQGKTKHEAPCSVNYRAT